MKNKVFITIGVFAVVIAIGVFVGINKTEWLIGFVSSIIAGICVWLLYEPLSDLKSELSSKPYVAVLVSEGATDFDVPSDVRVGFKEEWDKRDFFITKKNKKVRIEFKEDYLDQSKSSDIIQELIEDKNCVLLIANANSTLTHSNIDLLLKAKNKIPLIMPIATDNTIIKKTNAKKYKGVLRMLPDNLKQVETIKQFISNALELEDDYIAVFGDENNRSYSINMMENISSALRKSKKYVFSETLIGPSGYSLPSLNFLEKASAIVYAGVTHHAMLLKDQLRLINISDKVPFIMTDGCLGKSIYEQKHSEHTYVLSPINFEKDTKDTQKTVSYRTIGIDAYNLCAKILKKSKSTRESIYKTIENDRNSSDDNKTINIKSDSGKSYKFNADGNNDGWGYSVYQIKNNTLGDKIFE